MADEERPTLTGDGEREQESVPAYSFFGAYRHAMDQKGRIIIPNAYRDALGETFTIGTTRDFSGVALYPTDVFRSIVRDLEALNPRKPVVQKVKAQFFKLSYPDMQADAQGRILLPTALRQRFLGDAKDLEISGDHDSIRVMSYEASAQDDDTFFMNREELLDELGELNS